MKRFILLVLLALTTLGGAQAQYAVTSIPYNPYPYNAGTLIPLSIDDTWSGLISLPFSFEFYGNSYNQIVVGSNGLISFNAALANGYCEWFINSACPSSSLPGNCIFGPYHDMDNSQGGQLYYQTAGTAPDRRFVISVYQTPMYNCLFMQATHQIVLHETTNIIDVYVDTVPLCSSWNAGAALLGIQNSSGTQGLAAPGRNTGAWSASQEGWRFYSGTMPLVAVITDTVNADCGFSNGGLTVSVSGGIPPYTYLWNSAPAQTTAVLQNVAIGSYCVTVSDSTGATASTCAFVDSLTYPGPTICLVTADTASGHNRVVWEKPPASGITNYLIYRESAVPGAWDLINSQPFSASSAYLDLTSNSTSQSYHYRLAHTTSCGDTTMAGDAHTTIHLTISSGSVGPLLEWNAYEGFSFPYYHIYRGTDPGNLTPLTTVTYTDLDYEDSIPPIGNVYYQVEAIRPVPCVIAKNESGTRSNIVFTTITGLGSFPAENPVHLYPNPAKDIARLSIMEEGYTDLRITDLLGRQVAYYKIAHLRQLDLSQKDFGKGLFFLWLSGPEREGAMLKLLFL